MTNNATEGLSMIKTATELFDAVTAGPLWVIIAATAICLSLFLTWLKAFPNQAVAPTVVLVSTLLYGLLGDPKVYGPNQRYPVLMLMLTGFILGTAAWVSHVAVLSAARRKLAALIPGFSDRDSDTKNNQPTKDDHANDK